MTLTFFICYSAYAYSYCICRNAITQQERILFNTISVHLKVQLHNNKAAIPTRKIAATKEKCWSDVLLFICIQIRCNFNKAFVKTYHTISLIKTNLVSYRMVVLHIAARITGFQTCRELNKTAYFYC